MLKVCAIYGSNRRRGNSELLLDKLLEGIGEQEVEVYRVYAPLVNAAHCNACDACYHTGSCIKKDEMQEVYRHFEEADLVVTATPVYFHTVTSELKKIIDRCQAVWAGKYIVKDSHFSKKKRLGYTICTAGRPEHKSFFDCTIKVMQLFYHCINTKNQGELLVADVDTLPVKDRLDVQERAYNAGQELRKAYEELQ